MVYNLTLPYAEIMNLVVPGGCYERNLGPTTLDDAIMQAEKDANRLGFDCIYILNSLTGEIIAELSAEQEDDFDGDWDREMGFDPYEGCYTWDC